jgi:glutamate-ammonia-ligase adenylyltransferase
MADTTIDLSRPLPAPPDHSAYSRLCDNLEQRDRDGAQAFLDRLNADTALAALTAAIADASPYLSSLLERHPDFASDCFSSSPEDALQRLLAETATVAFTSQGEADVMLRLRDLKARSALLVALADITANWTLDETTAALTAFADAAVGAAIDWLLLEAQRTGKVELSDPQRPGVGSAYVVLAMGKHGARELNYSSDVDLIVLYDAELAPLCDGVEPSSLFVRITRGLVKILQERTRDGYVFRTDLRLRPDPRATNVAISLEAAALYYENMGQNWERAAMIKARPIAGDISAGAEFLERVAPFIWRKYLDFAAIADIQSLKRQIHAFKGHSEVAVAGHNIKLGRGGIREVEFFAQTQQLIAGGRVPALRGSRTVSMLYGLADHRWIDTATASRMDSAYTFLRMVEHRLQMVDDEQTHTLPSEPERLESVSRFCGFDDLKTFSETLLGHLRTVQGHYAALFEAASALGDEHGSLVFTGGEDDPETIENLSRMGFDKPSEISAAIRGWHFSRVPAMRSARSRELLTEIMPVLLEALARTGNPDQAFLAFDRFLSGLPAGVQLFSLFNANPPLLHLLSDILGSAPRLADFLSHRPRIFDAVLDPGFFGPLPGDEEIRAGVERAVTKTQIFEEVLDRARVHGREQRFRIGVRLLSDTIAADEAGRAYSILAESLIARLTDIVRNEFELQHGTVDGGELAVVAMGNLGGRGMNATSDLDLMLIYDHAPDAGASSGDRSIMPSQYFGRLTQRLINAISAQTSEGRLYEVDMRLRPSGNKGPIATHVDSFTAYHRESAWVWEKMALTRARAIAGDARLVETIDQAVRCILQTPRDRDAVAGEVAAMRERIAEEKPASRSWDIKHVRGGLIDIQFICQFLQIALAHERPELLDQNTAAVIEQLGQYDILPERSVQELADAHRLMDELNHILKVCLQDEFDPESAPEGLNSLLLRAADMPDIAVLDAALSDAQKSVKSVFNQVVNV